MNILKNSIYIKSFIRTFFYMFIAMSIISLIFFTISSLIITYLFGFENYDRDFWGLVKLDNDFYMYFLLICMVILIPIIPVYIKVLQNRGELDNTDILIKVMIVILAIIGGSMCLLDNLSYWYELVDELVYHKNIKYIYNTFELENRVELKNIKAFYNMFMQSLTPDEIDFYLKYPKGTIKYSDIHSFFSNRHYVITNQLVNLASLKHKTFYLFQDLKDIIITFNNPTLSNDIKEQNLRVAEDLLNDRIKPLLKEILTYKPTFRKY